MEEACRMKSKICRVCGIRQFLSEFHSCKDCSDGHANTCKACVNERQRNYAHSEIGKAKRKAWRAKNMSKIYDAVTRWRKKHPKEWAKMQNKWAKRNPDRVRENHRKWAEKNQDRVKANERRWRERNYAKYLKTHREYSKRYYYAHRDEISKKRKMRRMELE